MDIKINSVGFTENHIEVEYHRIPADIRKNGLIWSHAVAIPRGSDYDDEIETFVEALTTLLLDALDDESRAEPIDIDDTPTPDEEDDEDE